MKTYLKFFVVILSLFFMLLSSCMAAKPSSNSNNTGAGQENEWESSNNEQADTKNNGFTLLPWEEIKAKEREYPELLRGLDLEKLTISDSLTINIPEEVRTGNYIVTSGFEDRYEEVFSHYDDNYDEANTIDDGGKTYPTGLSYLNKEKNLRMSIGCTGFFTYTKGDFDFRTESEHIKTYTYTEAMNTNDSYKLMGSTGEVSVSDAATEAQRFADDFISFCNYQNVMRVNRICLYKCENGYFYEVCYTQMVSGINTLDYPPTYDKIQDSIYRGTTHAYICSEELTEFRALTIFEEYETDGKLDKAMDLTDATMYLDKKLAKNLHPEVKRIDFSYYLVRKGNIQKVKEGEESDREKAPWAIRCSYDIFDAKPCWIFYFDETVDKENYAVIDCTDMEVYYVDNKGRG